MAWDQVIYAQEFERIVTGSPASNVRNNHKVLAFDAAGTETVEYIFVLPVAYASGSNLSIVLYGSAASATSGAVRNQIAVERIGTTQDIDSDSFDTAVAATSATASGTSGIHFTTTFALANSAIDDPAAGEKIRIQLSRLGADGADTMTGDWEFSHMVLSQ